MKHNKILCLTVLNEIRHTRVFFKDALCLCAFTDVRVYIAGLDTHSNIRGPYRSKDLVCLPMSFEKPKGFQRVFVQYRYLRLLLRLKADIIHLHTPELLPILLFLGYFQIRRFQIVYVVHEDYYQNIISGEGYGSKSRWHKFLAGTVRFFERQVVKTGAYVVYTEECYDNILKATPNNYSVVRNKAVRYPSQPPPIQSRPYLLYCGTIAESWGVFEAARLWLTFDVERRYHFTIVGVAHRSIVLKKLIDYLQNSERKNDYAIIGGDVPVPHLELCRYIEHCKCGFALYRLLPHIKNKIPTKFYEFIAYQKPLVYTKNPVWDELDNKIKLGYALDENFSAIEAKSFGEWLENAHHTCYPTSPAKEDFDWGLESKEYERIYRKLGATKG